MQHASFESNAKHNQNLERNYGRREQQSKDGFIVHVAAQCCNSMGQSLARGDWNGRTMRSNERAFLKRCQRQSALLFPLLYWLPMFVANLREQCHYYVIHATVYSRAYDVRQISADSPAPVYVIVRPHYITSVTYGLCHDNLNNSRIFTSGLFHHAFSLFRYKLFPFHS